MSVLVVSELTIWLVLVSSLVACSSETAPTCVDDLSLDCAPLYDPPTYQTIFERTLRPTCGSGRGTCHTSDAQKGGLVFEDADAAYGLLIGQDGHARVVPGDPACSVLMVRLESNSPSFRMPPGPEPLPAAERCAIAKWIADGAAR